VCQARHRCDMGRRQRRVVWRCDRDGVYGRPEVGELLGSSDWADVTAAGRVCSGYGRVGRWWASIHCGAGVPDAVQAVQGGAESVERVSAVPVLLGTGERSGGRGGVCSVLIALMAVTAGEIVVAVGKSAAATATQVVGEGHRVVMLGAMENDGGGSGGVYGRASSDSGHTREKGIVLDERSFFLFLRSTPKCIGDNRGQSSRCVDVSVCDW
jgi:hypothetical protein